jgi:DNA-directed RNA polymerase subunit K/omega
MTKVLSRTQEIDVERCVVNAGSNRFDMILLLAARAREISKRDRETDPSKGSYPVVSALLELQNKQIGREYLKKVK